MQFNPPLTKARLIKRYKRFLADAELADGTLVTAHCANPGSMMGLAEPGTTIWLSRHDSKTRKLAYGWELVQLGEAYVGVNTGIANALVAEALARGEIEPLAAYSDVRREVRVGASRLDFRLTGSASDARDCYVEVKSVTLSRPATPGLAEFPDAVTTRGAKHLGELASLAENGQRAVMLFVVQRTDCTRFAPAEDIDPNYASCLNEAVKAGVELLCYDCQIDGNGINIDRPLPVVP